MTSEEKAKGTTPDNPMYWFSRVDKLVISINELGLDSHTPLSPEDLIAVALAEAYQLGKDHANLISKGYEP